VLRFSMAGLVLFSVPFSIAFQPMLDGCGEGGHLRPYCFISQGNTSQVDIWRKDRHMGCKGEQNKLTMFGLLTVDSSMRANDVQNQPFAPKRRAHFIRQTTNNQCYR